MADEIEEDVDLDMAGAAAELEAERAGGSQDGADPEDDEDLEDGAEEAEEEAEVVAAVSNAADDHETFLKANEGKPISFAEFKKRLDKERSRVKVAAEWEKKHNDLNAQFEGYKKTQPFGPDQAKLHTQYEDIFGKLKSGTTKMPFLAEAIVALGRGQTPDLRKLNSALSEYVQALPEADPRLLQMQQEQQTRLDRMEEAEFDRSLQAHIEREERAVSDLLGADPDPELIQLIDQIHEKMLPEKGDLKNLPDKVAIAKLLLSRDKKLEQRILKKQAPTTVTRRKAAIGTGGGPAASAKAVDEGEIPEPGTPEYEAWIAADYMKNRKA